MKKNSSENNAQQQQEYNPVNYALTSAQRKAGITIPVDSNGDMKFAFVVIAGKHPVKSFDFYITEQQMTATKIGIALAAKLAYKTAGVLVYAWGSDERWHVVDSCDIKGRNIQYPGSSAFHLINPIMKSFCEFDLPVSEQIAQYNKDMGIA